MGPGIGDVGLCRGCIGCTGFRGDLGLYSGDKGHRPKGRKFQKAP